ncbi:MAG: hypothetical protein KAJ07_01370, partial [Planctomycetes bacterium]|nr:hypothetical protein [Planctomycetota bacterium]
GETDTLKVYIEHGAAAAETTQACVFKVTDVSDAANYDTAISSIHMTAPKACIPNTFRLSGQCVFPCNPYGTGELEPLCCTTDETLQMGTGGDFGGWYCKEKVVSDGPSWFENLFGGDDNGLPSLNVILIGILIIVMIVIGLLMFYGILKAVIIKKLT